MTEKWIENYQACPHPPGFDEWRKGEEEAGRNDDEELEREILNSLKNRGRKWLEAIVWNVRGASDVKSPQLVSEARFIQRTLGRGDKAVWKRVVVIVNMSLAKGIAAIYDVHQFLIL